MYKCIVKAAHNDVFTTLYTDFSNVMKQAILDEVSDPNILEDEVDYHKKLFNAIKEKNVEAARSATQSYFDTMIRVLNKLLKA